jgi:hypothetical protein
LLLPTAHVPYAIRLHHLQHIDHQPCYNVGFAYTPNDIPDHMCTTTYMKIETNP